MRRLTRPLLTRRGGTAFSIESSNFAILTVVCIENLIRFDCVAESHNASANGRADILLAKRGCLALQVESRLEAENAALRHQLTVLQGKVRGHVQFTNSDRLFFIQLYRWFPSILKAIRSSDPGLSCA